MICISDWRYVTLHYTRSLSDLQQIGFRLIYLFFASYVISKELRHFRFGWMPSKGFASLTVGKRLCFDGSVIVSQVTFR